MAKANLAPATGDCNPTPAAKPSIPDGPKTALEDPPQAEQRMVTIPESLFVVALYHIRRSGTSVDIAAGIIREMFPTEDADGDISLEGRQVQWLTSMIDNETQELFEQYEGLMKAAGFEPDRSGLYG